MFGPAPIPGLLNIFHIFITRVTSSNISQDLRAEVKKREDLAAALSKGSGATSTKKASEKGQGLGGEDGHSLWAPYMYCSQFPFLAE